MLLGVFLAFLFALIITPEAKAETYGFYPITNLDEAALVTDQLLVDVFDGDGTAKFKFRNVGTTDCSITDIYFDDGSLLGITQLIDADEGVGGHPGVDFSLGATPGDLPGGELAIPAFEASRQFNMDSDPPPTSWGIEPADEWLQVDFELINMGTLDDVLAELSDGTLRIGIHVQKIGGVGGGSASFINNPTPVPEPTSLLLIAFGAGLLRRKRKS